MKPAAVTGVGGWPGTDAGTTARIVRDECELLAHLVELPERGPGGDMIGRTMARLAAVSSDFSVATVPSGWRLAPGRGRDMSRAQGYWSQDLDTLEEVFAGYEGDLKIQLVGPWTLAASVEGRDGERIVRDLGAVREIAQVLVEAWGALLADVTRRIPSAQLLMQVDEPLVADVMAGRVATQSGWATYPAADHQVVVDILALIRGSWRGAATLHCCAADYPFAAVRAAGFDAASFDVSAVGSPAIAGVGEQIDAGGFAMVGVTPGGTVADAVATLTRLGSAVGYSGMEWASHLVLTPPCDLLGMPLSQARGTMSWLGQVARALQEVD